LRAPAEEVVDYFVLAFQILKNVGLEATGITSPWNSGIDCEQKYAQALADAIPVASSPTFFRI